MIHSVLIESALRSLLTAAIVWTGLRLFRITHVLAQKVAWTLVLASAIALPLQILNPGRAAAAHEFVLPVYRVLPPVTPFPAAPLRHSSRELQHAAANTAGIAMPHASVPDPDAPSSHPLPGSRSSTTAATRRPLSNAAWIALGTSLYLILCAILLSRVLFGLAAAFGIWRRALPLEQSGDAGEDSSAAVRVSAEIGAPVTLGSCVILPASYSEWPATKLRVVLAHEQSHVVQGDFYLQLAARLYTALFWFSPLGWWLQYKLSDLGEAMSDRAALQEAPSAPSYAEILLEFAASPRLSQVGVGMARSSNLQSRVDRLLNENDFRLAFVRGRRHAWIAVPLAVIAFAAATTHFRVQAAEEPRSDLALVTIPPPEVLLAASPSQSANPPVATQKPQDSYAIVDGQSGVMTVYGSLGNDFDKVRRSHTGSYIWLRRDGKSYIIDDPALVAQSQQISGRPALFGAGEEQLAEAARILAEQQANLTGLQAQIAVHPIVIPQIVIPKIDVAAIRANIDASLKSLDLDGKPILSEQELNDLNTRLAEASQKIAEMQAKAGSQQATIEAQTSVLREKQAALAQKQAQLAAEQARMALSAPQQMKRLLDQALRDGKAKPAQ
jgi:BlaR1 peptidase M56